MIKQTNPNAARPTLVALACVLSTASGAAVAAPLAGLGADLEGLTVSGLSSGGYMATQFQVAHSALVRGAGVFASGPYDCAEGDLERALSHCMAPDGVNLPPSPEETLARIRAYAEARQIDPVGNLGDDRVWVFSGGADRTVTRPVVEALVSFYREQVEDEALRYVTLPTAGHAMISVAAPGANACGSTASPYVNRCGEFDAAGEMLAHLTGALQPKVAAREAGLRSFDQASHTPLSPVDLSMAKQGMVYVPQACEAGGCRVHVVFHGCRQGTDAVGQDFVRGAGYNEWAEANRLIVLYPQVHARHGMAWGSWRWVYNPQGCWDWWGYSGKAYPTRDGGQIRAVHSMLQQLAEPVSGPAGTAGN
ncbi:extracellular catalytic domain type 2 short-chain-length polyhydroxyalkanoate depolymerase [Pseudazoarcus pumilus]|nr:PHB depolymerase family esterase [Pseudazoarcus pumilus]